jgi:uncharacterized membrane protein
VTFGGNATFNAVAVGGVAVGGVAIGGVTFGGNVAFNAVAVSGVAIGGVTFGGDVAFDAVAVGGVAIGGVTFGGNVAFDAVAVSGVTPPVFALWERSWKRQGAMRWRKKASPTDLPRAAPREILSGGGPRGWVLSKARLSPAALAEVRPSWATA